MKFPSSTLTAPINRLAVKMDKELTADLWKAARNITTDIFFTNFELAEKLMTKQTNCVGTVRKNKRDIPRSFIAKKRDANTSIFGFNKHSTLVFYVPKKNKTVLLLSTMHHDKAMDVKKGKPKIIMFYSTMKGAVDTVDQLYHSYSAQKIKRQSLFYLMDNDNLTDINVLVFYVQC